MNTEKAIKTSSARVRSFLHEAEKLLAETGDTADEKVRNVRDRLRGALDNGHQRFDRVRESAREQLDHYDTYVHEKPYYAIGAAVLLGTLAGILLCRRR